MTWVTSDMREIPDDGKVICWDLDSTLRSTVHRRHMVPEIRAGRSTWVNYSMACADDTPIEGAVTLLRILSNEAWNVAVSGANQSALELTRSWSKQHDIPLDDFILRPDEDHCPNGQWKVKAVRKLRAAGLDVVLFVEDWAESAAYIREHTGVPVLGVNPFDADTVLLDRRQLASALETGLCTDQESAYKLSGSIFDQLTNL